ncbi:hypothetical protein EIP91_001514 [Steccherinum ochraceum]|uniref:Ubiquitin 3 binding protein But2 C-terminal domain-containing protein n=1 Tax=Steccherinum ochraceum TaxID=92696 RepID=A0A4R0S2V1_9APHY|nr:hypothetical protein EIP91_001514 [Steccherinum ochraceum]
MSLFERLVYVLAVCACATFVLGIPTFDGMGTFGSINNLVSGLTSLEAVGTGGVDPQDPSRHYLAILAPRGLPGNATVYRAKSPPLFYVRNDQLWHFHNESTIHPVSVHNSTASSELPLQVVIGDKYGRLSRKTEVKGGSWRWQGTMLRYEQGTHSTPLFYSCQDTNGLMGLFLFLDPRPPPAGCSPFTLHSFLRSQ